MALLARFRRNVLLKTVSDILTRGLTFLFGVVVARRLGKEEYGIMSSAQIAAYQATIIADLGLHLLVTREVAARRARGDHDIAAYVGNLFSLKLVLMVVVLGVVGALSRTPWYHDVAVPLMISGVFMISWSALEFACSALSGYERMEWEAVLKGTGRTLVILIAGGALFAGHGLHGVLIGMAASPILVLLAGTVLLRRRGGWRTRWDTTVIRKAIRNAIPLAAVNVLATVFVRIDILLLEVLRGNHQEIGIYQAALALVVALGGIAMIFSGATFPIVSDLVQTSPASFRALARDLLRLMAFLGFPVFSVAFMLAPLIVRLVYGPEYAEAAHALRLLIADVPLLYLNLQLSNMLLAGGRQRTLLIPALIAFITNVGMNAILIPRHGYEGAAIATVATEATLFVVITIAGRGFFPPGFPFFLWRFALAGGLALAVFIPLRGMGAWVALPASLAVWASTLAITREISGRDLERLRSLAGSRLPSFLTGRPRSG